jgi:uncharacterized protein (DUF433 family)
MSVLTERIVREIESAPEPVQAEVLDFLLFVKARSGGSAGSDRGSVIRRTPGVCGGDACIGLTRVAVWILEEARRAGVGELDLLKDYPGLSVNDLEAAWSYVEAHREEIEETLWKNREV